MLYPFQSKFISISAAYKNVTKLHDKNYS